ncbi:MAG: 4'-phosphopantetheinyl transferase superfamily protein [Wenzhouxiangellaceae bacterium]|nr:4'-phosphopantetheinyl transferase superfamily protein [Wenzhouxiangellaceae bacterium]
MRRVDLPLRDLEMPAEGEVHAWFTRLANLPVMEAGTPGHRSAEVRQQRMAQRFVLRLLLGAYLGRPGRDVAIERTAAGKPRLVDDASGLEFSLSHTGERLAIAVARGVPVGVDIEPEGRALRWRRLATRYFPPAEAEQLVRIDDEESGRCRFLRHWTAREALIKAVGRTIAGHVGAVELADEGGPALRALPEDWPAPEKWTLAAPEAPPDLVVHLAAPRPGLEVRSMELRLEPPGPG